MSALNPWHKGVLVAFDTETTGINTALDRIVTACVLTITPPKSIAEKNWLIDPGIDIPEAASKIHGITTEKARAEGTDPAVALLEIVNALRHAWEAGWALVGQNVMYDLSILDMELARYGLGSIHSHGGPGMVVDTLAIDRLVRPKWRGKRRLEDLAQAYAVDQDPAHNARGDAITAARVAFMQAERFPFDVQLDLHELMDRQQRAHRAWAEEFGAYLRSQQRPDDVQRDWPYRPAAALGKTA